MNNSNNQIRNKMINSHPKTDGEKLAGIERMMINEYPVVSVTLEPFMLFTKGEDEYQGWFESLYEEQVKKFIVHPPDIVLRFRCLKKNREVFFELDGPIHDIKTAKTAKRDTRYELNDLDYFVINETNLKEELGVAKSNPLSQEQINTAFLVKFKWMLQSFRK